MCGKQVQNVVIPLIENGEVAGLGEFPWHTAIYDKTSMDLLICAGTIISPYAVLSGKLQTGGFITST